MFLCAWRPVDVEVIGVMQLFVFAETGMNFPVFSAETGATNPVFSAETGATNPNLHCVLGIRLTIPQSFLRGRRPGLGCHLESLPIDHCF
jgi:hypothetical protein